MKFFRARRDAVRSCACHAGADAGVGPPAPKGAAPIKPIKAMASGHFARRTCFEGRSLALDPNPRACRIRVARFLLLLNFALLYFTPRGPGLGWGARIRVGLRHHNLPL